MSTLFQAAKLQNLLEEKNNVMKKLYLCGDVNGFRNKNYRTTFTLRPSGANAGSRAVTAHQWRGGEGCETGSSTDNTTGRGHWAKDEARGQTVLCRGRHQRSTGCTGCKRTAAYVWCAWQLGCRCYRRGRQGFATCCWEGGRHSRAGLARLADLHALGRWFRYWHCCFGHYTLCCWCYPGS